MSGSPKSPSLPSVMTTNGCFAQQAELAVRRQECAAQATPSGPDGAASAKDAVVVVNDDAEEMAPACAGDAHASPAKLMDNDLAVEVDYEESDDGWSPYSPTSPTPARVSDAQVASGAAKVSDVKRQRLDDVGVAHCASVRGQTPPADAKSSPPAADTAVGAEPYPVGPYVPDWALDPSQRGASDPLYPWPLFATQGLVDDEHVRERHFDPHTDDRNRFYIDLSFQYQMYNSKRNNARSTLLQAWNAFVKNFNGDAASFVRSLHDARERYERHSLRGRLNRIHDECVNANIPCGVPESFDCLLCAPGAERMTTEGARGYDDYVVPLHIRDMINNVARFDRSNAGAPSNASGTDVGARGYAIRIPAGHQARLQEGVLFAPTLRTREGNLSNELDTDDLSYQYHESGAADRARGSLARSSAVRPAHPPPPPVVEGEPSASASRAQPAVAGPASAPVNSQAQTNDLSVQVREHAAIVGGLREEIRQILLSQVSASQRVEFLTARYYRLRADHDALMERHETLQSDYRGLLAEVSEQGIRRGDARRRCIRNTASDAQRKT